MSAVPQIPPEHRSSAATSLDRRIQMLRTAMGPLIAAALEDPDVVEIMLNPDRTLWVDRLSSGRTPLGVERSRSIIRTRGRARRRGSASWSTALDRRVAGNRRTLRGHLAAGRAARPSRCASGP